MKFEKFGHIDSISDLPEGTVALMDYDSGSCPRIMQLNSICRILGIEYSSLMLHRTRRGWHLAIAISGRFKRVELIALQAILGSDPMREAMNLARVRQIEAFGAPKYWLQRHNILYDYKL